MALCPAVAPGLLRAYGWGCVRAVGPACSLLGGPAWRRELHVSSAVSAKSLLRKFASKTKKKFWYDSPTLGTQFKAKKPDDLLGLMKVQKKQRREDSIRMQTLNSILHKALSDLLSTPEVSEDVYNLNMELSKVSLAVDFSACRAYWIASGNAETDNRVEKVLVRYAPHFRHLLITRQVLGGVPPIVFVRDKENAMIHEIDRLLAIADFGDDYNGSATHGEFREWEHTSAKRSDRSSKVISSPDSNLFGIDHGDLNRQIQDYKTRMKDRVKEDDIVGLSLHHQEQLAEIRRQKIMKKKMRELKSRFDDNDITPQKYLMDRYDDNEEVPSEYLEFEDDVEVVLNQLDESEEERRTNPKGGS